MNIKNSYRNSYIVWLVKTIKPLITSYWIIVYLFLIYEEL